MSDESFREIQLNGKQLVFLFMAATVVLVVSFLFGVLVGRGVGPAATVAETTSAEIAPDPGAAPPQPEPAPQASTPPAPPPVATEAAPPAEELSYAERLLRDEAPKEHLKEPSSAKPAPAKSAPPPPQTTVQPPTPSPAQAQPPVAAAPAPSASPPPSTARAATPPAESPPVAPAAASDPSGPGYAVQVAAYKDRREADALAKQLIAKGYPAFVMDPIKGAPTTMFRVRVGKYKSLKDAEAVSARLQRAEQFKPWIAR